MKTKIVLDADVIIHFIKAGQFSLLLDIFPEYPDYARDNRHVRIRRRGWQ